MSPEEIRGREAVKTATFREARFSAKVIRDQTGTDPFDGQTAYPRLSDLQSVSRVWELHDYFHSWSYGS
jgi:hypothetical protein